MKRFGVVAILILASCARAGGAADSGIEGRVLLGPQCPVVSEESPCPDKPVVAEVVAIRLEDREEFSARSGSDGRFRLALGPGTYEVQALVTAGAMFAKPVNVTVPPGEFVRVDVLLDTGIREPVGEA
ncbi:MAG: carboxypeptidase-like regulatory domain-containing protein [Actinomycetota bacterium]